ncbi:MAG TPA: DUF308 domain-containing protein [Candidatus Angelobacter sp.]|nr:DUF308 domain-containing protein [Candidatus Angelobacter sp.]
MIADEGATIGLSRWWWLFVLRGVVAIGFGILAFLAPGWGIAILVALFAAWAILDGVGNLLAGWRTRNQDRSWWLEVLEGVVSIGAGVIAIALPDFAAQALVLIIGAWAVITGVIEIVMAVRLRRVIRGELWMGLAGLASILFGILIIVFPAAGALSLVWLISAFAITFGAFEIGLGWRLRSHERGPAPED